MWAPHQSTRLRIWRGRSGPGTCRWRTCRDRDDMKATWKEARRSGWMSDRRCRSSDGGREERTRMRRVGGERRRGETSARTVRAWPEGMPWCDTKTLVIEGTACTVAALVAVAVDARPRGSSVPSLVEIKTSELHGRGLFAKENIAQGTTLGRYPGRRRTPQQMVEKCERAPRAKDYVYQTEEGVFLDPTDNEGKLSNKPGPGPPWPFPVQVDMALANEPPPGSGGANVEFQEKRSDVILVSTRDVSAGEELYLDYGTRYSRSGYA